MYIYIFFYLNDLYQKHFLPWRAKIYRSDLQKLYFESDNTNHVSQYKRS